MILIKEVKYSNQAKTVLGIVKMMQVTTKKMVTFHRVSTTIISRLVSTSRGDGLSSAANHPSTLARLTRSSLGEISTCPELDEDVEESSFRGNNGCPTCARLAATRTVSLRVPYLAILQNQHQTPELDQPIGPHNRYNYPMWERQWSSRRETVRRSRRTSRPIGTQ